MKDRNIGLPPYSVLMLVYNKCDPDQFFEALRSMFGQTLPPEQLVLVCDGELTPRLDGVIDRFTAEHPDVMTVLRTPERNGVGLSSNRGLESCRNDIVVRMDSDDISEPDRCMTTMLEFASDPSLDLVGGFILEFEDEDTTKGNIRAVPTERDEMIRYARRRNPFNNVTVAYRKSKVLNCGGYRQLNRAEDYDLYVRMLMSGARCKTLPKVMVRVRTDAEGYRRRKTLEHTKSLISVRWDFYRMGFTSLADFLIMSFSHIAAMLMPSSLLRYIYRKKLRIQG